MHREIVAVDDNPPALARIKRAVSGRPDVEVRTFQTEREALEMINGFRKGDKLPIFFLDLNLKGEGDGQGAGHRILRAIRTKKALRLTPVVVVSNSDDSDSITNSYKLGANAYHIKRGKDELLKVVEYWLNNDQDRSVLHKRYA